MQPVKHKLPARPNLEHLKRMARQLLTDARQGQPEAAARLQRYFATERNHTLAQAQLTTAREHGFSSWRALKQHVEAVNAHGPRLIEAVQGKDLTAVRQLLAGHPTLADLRVDGAAAGLAPDAGEMSLLQLCVALGREGMVEAVLAHGAELEVRNDFGRTALHDSLELGQNAMTRLLLRHGAEVDVCGAALMGDEAALRALLEREPAQVHDGSTGLSPLGWASYGGYPRVLSVLLSFGAELDPFDALFPAASCDHDAFLQAAIAAGADVRAVCGCQERTALHEAALLPFTDDAGASARVLLRAGARPDARDGDGATPLDLARRAAADRPRPGQRFEAMIALLEDAHAGR